MLVPHTVRAFRLHDGAAQAVYKAGSSYCAAADGAKISTQSTTLFLLETRQETSVKRCTGSRNLIAVHKGKSLISLIFKY